MDKSWMHANKTSVQYREGVNKFIKFAFDHLVPEGSEIYCPCIRCNNCFKKGKEEVEIHLCVNGIVKNYVRWVFHGEDFESQDTDDNTVNDSDELDHEMGPNYNNEMQDIIDDIFVEQRGEASPGQNHNVPSCEADKLERLMRDAEQELYPGCTQFSKLSFITNLLHLKLIHGWTNKSFTELLELLKQAFPEGETLPCSYYRSKKVIRDLGLNYEKIHACKNDCILYWKEYANEDKCPKCSTPRYKSRKGKKGKRVPHKVLRYFPLKPRLQRLFLSRKTAREMRWHRDKRPNEDNVLRHPADSEAWKDFDKRHELFASESRNVRLGLATDGFNPFGHKNSYSIWPVFLVAYNLPPWMFMKTPFIMMPLLIPGRRAPGNDIDVFLRPVIDDLKELWEVGVETYDASTGKKFQIRVALLWTINDFPAYANLSGWSTKGKLACPSCNKETSNQYLRHWKKTCYMGHRRFLPQNHHFRISKDFNGLPEHKPKPKLLSGEEILEQLDHVEQPIFGKVGEKRKRNDRYLNWTKKSIFFELPYWKTLKLRHNLDVMHIEKNVCDSILGTLMDVTGKSKDSYKARLDLLDLGIRSSLHPKVVDGKTIIEPAPCFLSPKEKKVVSDFLSSTKLPDGYSSNISRNFIDGDCGISGLKSHDCHVIIQRLLPLALRGCLKKDVRHTLIEVGIFFKELSSKTLRIDVLERLEKDIVLILCKLEKYFLPSFFDIMVHLLIHLPREAMLAGPVQCRWMYPFERMMFILKRYDRNKARPEGSIAEGFIDNEALNFCSLYFGERETRLHRRERNNDEIVSDPQHASISVFKHKVRGIGRKEFDEMDLKDLRKVQWFVLNNCDEVQPLIEKYRAELESQGCADVNEKVESEFHSWFLSYVTNNQTDVSKELLELAHGPDFRVIRYGGCIVNGIKFHTTEHELSLKTQNSGVVVKGDHEGQIIDFYGVVKDVIELKYFGNNRVFIFKCDWWDMGNRRTACKVDEHNFISVNVTKTWYREDPFVFAGQAEQVVYLPDTRFGLNYRVVQKICPRSIFDIPVKEENDETMDEPYQQPESSEFLPPVRSGDESNEIYREDMDLTDVYVESSNVYENDFMNTNETDNMNDNGEDEEDDEENENGYDNSDEEDDDDDEEDDDDEHDNGDNDNDDNDDIVAQPVF